MQKLARRQPASALAAKTGVSKRGAQPRGIDGGINEMSEIESGNRRCA